MFYIVKITDGVRYLRYKFETEKDMLIYFASQYKAYEDFVSRQNLTGNDIRKIRSLRSVIDYENEIPIGIRYTTIVYTETRDLQLLDGDYRTLDIRDYKSAIDAITEADIAEYFCRHRKRRQHMGRTHKKSGHYSSHCPFRSISKEPDMDYADYDIPVRIKHRKHKTFDEYYDYYSFSRMENNWKQSKVRKQYMWHKKPSEIIDVRAYKYYNIDMDYYDEPGADECQST